MDDNLILTDSRPTRADAVKNRELLLRTAQRLFATLGVDDVTMSQIADAAGVGKGTLYRHFANKMELCQELIDQDQRDLQNRTLARLREHGAPLSDLEWYLGEVIGFIMRNEWLFFTEASFSASLGHPAHQWWRQTIRGLLRQINPTIDIDYTADILFVMLDPSTIHYQMTVRGYTVERITAALTDALRRLVA